MALRLSTANLFHRMVSFRLFSSSKVPEGKTVLTNDESTFVSWHPQQDFPYECTKPLPQQIMAEDSSVLKTQLTPELLSVLNKKTPEQARLELMNITHTTKHLWFPRSRDRKFKKSPMEREYL